jgi:hydrogenase maturation factor
MINAKAREFCVRSTARRQDGRHIVTFKAGSVMESAVCEPPVKEGDWIIVSGKPGAYTAVVK